MKKGLILLLLLVSVACFAQQANNYKYIMLPEQFEFQKSRGQYDLNNLTKMALEKYGFTVFYTGSKVPDDLALDRCKALHADVVESGFSYTVLTIVLKDCNGNVVFESAGGKSKIKDRQKSYYEALREASHSLDKLNYRYTGKEIIVSKPVTRTETVTLYVPSVEAPQATVTTNENPLVAKPAAYGFELQDKSQKTVLKLYKTTQADYYSAKIDTKNGVVFKKGDTWFFEYYDADDKLVSEQLNIKF